MIKRTFVESDARRAIGAAAIDPALVDTLKIDFGGQLVLREDTAY